MAYVRGPQEIIVSTAGRSADATVKPQDLSTHAGAAEAAFGLPGFRSASVPNAHP